MSNLKRVIRWASDNPAEFVGLVLAIITWLFFTIRDPSLWWLPPLVLLGLFAIYWLLRRYLFKRPEAYYPIVLTWQEGYDELVLEDAQRFFSELGIPKAQTRPIVKVEPVDASRWDDLIREATYRFNEVKRDYGEIHLISQAYWLWNFALGTETQDRYPVVLYHHQESTYYRIWRMSREIKQRASASKFSYTTCKSPELFRQGSRDDAVALVFAVGPRDPSPAVEAFVGTHLPDLPAWIVRREQDLDPEGPERWITAATELACAIESISEAGTRELYLFGIVPDTLGLMVGSAIGPYRRIHLMQYLDGLYKEMLQLPLATS